MKKKAFEGLYKKLLKENFSQKSFKEKSLWKKKEIASEGKNFYKKLPIKALLKSFDKNQKN